MWPFLLDMTKEESLQTLRSLELEAYAALVTALRAQGALNTDKMKLLNETSSILNISQERHKAEVRRAVNDEKLNTIAYQVSGDKQTTKEWSREGQRLIPLMPRVAAQTAYVAIADETADATNKSNKLLPNPSNTERKRLIATARQSPVIESKPSQFRIPDSFKCDDKKRRLSPEVSSSTHSTTGHPKLSRIQQIYRQKTRARQREQLQIKIKQEAEKQQKQDGGHVQHKPSHQQFQHQIQQKLQQNLTAVQNQVGGSKFVSHVHPPEEVNEISILIEPNRPSSSTTSQQGCSNENVVPKAKTLVAIPKLSGQHVTLRQMGTSPGGDKITEVRATRKTPHGKGTTGQQLMVVSCSQTVTTSSILQRTLTVPFVKNISVKNIDKFKIVSTDSPSSLRPQPSMTTAVSAAVAPIKHKVAGVRSGSSVKKVIPLSQFQVLNTKGNIKVLPFGGKIVSKANVGLTGSTPVYIVNSNGVPCFAKSTTSAPPSIMTSGTQEGFARNQSQENLASGKKLHENVASRKLRENVQSYKSEEMGSLIEVVSDDGERRSVINVKVATPSNDKSEETVDNCNTFANVKEDTQVAPCDDDETHMEKDNMSRYIISDNEQEFAISRRDKIDVCGSGQPVHRDESLSRTPEGHEDDSEVIDDDPYYIVGSSRRTPTVVVSPMSDGLCN